MADDSNKRQLKENEVRTRLLIKRMLYYWIIFLILRVLAHKRATKTSNVLHILVFLMTTYICRKLC